jgi:hypothetical protein
MESLARRRTPLNGDVLHAPPCVLSPGGDGSARENVVAPEAPAKNRESRQVSKPSWWKKVSPSAARERSRGTLRISTGPGQDKRASSVGIGAREAQSAEGIARRALRGSRGGLDLRAGVAPTAKTCAFLCLPRRVRACARLCAAPALEPCAQPGSCAADAVRVRGSGTVALPRAGV